MTWVIDWNPLWKDVFWAFWVAELANRGVLWPAPATWQTPLAVVMGLVAIAYELAILVQWFNRRPA